MLKLLTLTFAVLSFQAQAYTSLESTLMYKCNNAALAMGGYDEYYVNISVNDGLVSTEDRADFDQFTKDYLKVKKITQRNTSTTYVVRAADLGLWSEVALSLESFLSAEGFRGSCDLDL